jgi:3-oxoadipate enol-lactonase
MPAPGAGWGDSALSCAMPFAPLEDLKLYYADEGRGQTAMLLLHGLASSSDDWGLQAPVFGQSYRLLIPDLRGHGRSEFSGRRMSIVRMADDVAELLDQLGEAPVHVLGLSMGGCVAQALALRHPRHVRSLVLVNTFARYQPAGWRGAGRVARRLWLLAFAPMPAIASAVARGLFPRPDQHALYEQASARLGRMTRRNYLAAMRALAVFDVREQLSDVRCPVLILAGDRDQTVPRAATSVLQHAIPHARVCIIPDSGHATPYDQVERFNREVLQFVDAN